MLALIKNQHVFFAGGLPREINDVAGVRPGARAGPRARSKAPEWNANNAYTQGNILRGVAATPSSLALGLAGVLDGQHALRGRHKFTVADTDRGTATSAIEPSIKTTTTTTTRRGRTPFESLAHTRYNAHSLAPSGNAGLPGPVTSPAARRVSMGRLKWAIITAITCCCPPGCCCTRQRHNAPAIFRPLRRRSPLSGLCSARIRLDVQKNAVR